MDLDFNRLGIQLVVAIVCAGIANTLIPRRIPGNITGLVMVGLVGVWIGEWLIVYLSQLYDLNYAPLHWNIQQVRVIPAIIGCTVVLFLLKLLMQWGRYER